MSDIIIATAALTVTAASAYASGNVIGGKLTLANVAQGEGRGGILQSVSLFSKSAQTFSADLLVFHSDPIGTTFTDKTALALATSDFDKLVDVIHITDWTSLGGPSLGQGRGCASPYKLPTSKADLYAVLVSRGTPTFTATTDLKIAARTLPD